MIFPIVNVLVILSCILFVMSVIRLQLVHTHVRKRIDEVYVSKNWQAYEIDIDDMYDRAIWDYRKWTYKQFFPEDVK